MKGCDSDYLSIYSSSKRFRMATNGRSITGKPGGDHPGKVDVKKATSQNGLHKSNKESITMTTTKSGLTMPKSLALWCVSLYLRKTIGDVSSAAGLVQFVAAVSFFLITLGLVQGLYEMGFGMGSAHERRDVLKEKKTNRDIADTSSYRVKQSRDNDDSKPVKLLDLGRLSRVTTLAEKTTRDTVGQTNRRQDFKRNERPILEEKPKRKTEVVPHEQNAKLLESDTREKQRARDDERRKAEAHSTTQRRVQGPKRKAFAFLPTLEEQISLCCGRRIHSEFLNNQSLVEIADSVALAAIPPKIGLSMGFPTTYKDLAQHIEKVISRKLHDSGVKDTFLVRIAIIRSIYRWIANNIAYDYISLRRNTITSEKCAPEIVFKDKLGVCSGYANLLQVMIDCLNLDGVSMRTVSGHTKNESPGSVGHAWNLLEIDGESYLMDCTWSAGYVNDGKPFVRKWNEFHFCTPADQFALHHYPTEPINQLLDPPISRSRFESLPECRADFFKASARLTMYHHRVLNCSHDSFTLSFEMSSQWRVGEPRLKLEKANRGGKNQPFEGLVRAVQPKGSGQVRIDVRVPSLVNDSDLILEVFASPDTKSDEGNSPYVCLFEHVIKVQKCPTRDLSEPAQYPKYLFTESDEVGPLERYIKSNTTKQFWHWVPAWYSKDLVEGMVAIFPNNDWRYIDFRETRPDGARLFAGNITVDCKAGDISIWTWKTSTAKDPNSTSRSSVYCVARYTVLS